MRNRRPTTRLRPRRGGASDKGPVLGDRRFVAYLARPIVVSRLEPGEWKQEGRGELVLTEPTGS
jgi:hypothetical protein